MVRYAALMVSLACVLLVCGCAAPRQSASTQDASVEWRLRTLEEKALVFQNAQLEQASRVGAVERRLDDLEETRSQLRERDLPPEEGAPEPLMSSDELPEPGPVVVREEPKPAAPEPVAQADKHKDDGKEWDSYPDATTKPAKKPAPKVQPAPAPKPAAKAAPKTYPVKQAAKPKAPAGRAAYERGLKLVLAGKTAQGRAALEDFLRDNPGSGLAPNAHYWLGESYYHEKRFAESVVAFKKVHQKYPKHPKAPAALLKIGYAYAQLGDKENARFYLEVLLQDYPDSEPAPLARKRLKTL